MKVLLVGLRLRLEDEARLMAQKDKVQALFGAGSLAEVLAIVREHGIDVAVMGAGLELEERLAIVRALYEHSDKVCVHLKDRASGPAGFAPFVERVIEMHKGGPLA